jgi:serine/threonine protein kinase
MVIGDFMNKRDEIFKFEPLFGKWIIKEFLGSGSIGKVYKISSIVNTKEYISAVKYLSFPTEDIYNGAVNSLGNNKEMISNYFKNYIDSIVNEIDLLYELKGHSNIISYEDHQINRVENEDEWNIFIRMEYAISLKEILKDKSLTEKEILKLGIDICNALEFCHSKNIIHRDIKEANIFISNNNNSYKLGDFSVSKNISENTSAMTKVGTINYMPPEVLKGEKYTKNTDIYSLGIVLYKLFNRGKIPFLPENQNNITQNDIETAISKRISGQEFSKPNNMRKNIYQILKKACSYNPNDRYQEVAELKNDLESCLSSLNSLNITDNKNDETLNYNNGTVDIFSNRTKKVKQERLK